MIDEQLLHAIRNPIARREFIARMAVGAVGLSTGVLACDDQPSAPVPPEQSGLEHIIVVMMENRSYDHFLGWLPRGDGKQAGLVYTDMTGTPHETRPLAPDFKGCGFADPNHTYAGGRQEYNGGACDGWLRTHGNDVYALGYYTAEDLPFFQIAAVEWTVLDRMFSAIMGPTGPNRLILHAGQTDSITAVSSPNPLPTIWDRLAEKEVTAANYVHRFYFASMFRDRHPGLARPIESFFLDAAAGTLPHVAFVEPDTYNDDHPHNDIRNGQAFLANVYQAITMSPVWRSSLFIITYDEWGGFFDHVPPPVAPIPDVERAAGNVDGLRGFRVPALLISPFARRRHTSSKMYDHASILRLIEWRWGLEPLSVRDAEANNLADELDFSNPNTSVPLITAPQGHFGVRCL